MYVSVGNRSRDLKASFNIILFRNLPKFSKRYNGQGDTSRSGHLYSPCTRPTHLLHVHDSPPVLNFALVTFRILLRFNTTSLCPCAKRTQCRNIQSKALAAKVVPVKLKTPVTCVPHTLTFNGKYLLTHVRTGERNACPLLWSLQDPRAWAGVHHQRTVISLSI